MRSLLIVVPTPEPGRVTAVARAVPSIGSVQPVAVALTSGGPQGGIGAAVAVGSAVGAAVGAVAGALGGGGAATPDVAGFEARALPATTLAAGQSAEGYVYYPRGQYSMLEFRLPIEPVR